MKTEELENKTLEELNELEKDLWAEWGKVRTIIAYKKLQEAKE